MSPYDDDDIGKNFILTKIRYGLANKFNFMSFAIMIKYVNFLDDSGADCVVCMCEIRDTIILPCRHLCLCYTCAESLRFQVCTITFKVLT